MGWFRGDDGAAFHHKIVMAGNEAVGAWFRACSWCAGKSRGGFIPFEMAHLLAPAAVWERLAVVGLLDATERPGYQIHDFNVYNPTDEELDAIVEKRRRAGAVGGKRSGEARRSKNEASASPHGEASAEASASGLLNQVLEHVLEQVPKQTRSKNEPTPTPTPTQTKEDPPQPPRGGGEGERSSEIRISKEPNPEALRELVDAFRAGLGSVTGQPVSGISRGDARALAQALAHARPPPDGPLDPVGWMRETAADFARKVDPAFGGFSVRRFVVWLNSGRPAAPRPGPGPTRIVQGNDGATWVPAKLEVV